MLKIRKEQMEVFEQAAIRNFEDEMVQHLKKFSSRHCEVIGEDNVRKVIRMGIERGKKYICENLTWDMVVERVEGIYHEVLQAKRSAP